MFVSQLLTRKFQTPPVAVPPIRQEEAFPPKAGVDRGSFPQGASLEAGLWKFQHKHSHPPGSHTDHEQNEPLFPGEQFSV